MISIWSNLRENQRIALVVSVVMIVVLLAYIQMILPWQRENNRLRVSILEQHNVLQWMTQAKVELQELRSIKGNDAYSGQSLMSIIDDSTRNAGIANAVRQLRPDEIGVSVRLEDVGFDAMLKWLSFLHSHYNITVNHFSMDRLSRSGHINANIILVSRIYE